MRSGSNDTAQASVPRSRLVGDDERAAACALSALPGVGAQSLRLLAERFGSLAQALDAGPERMAQTPGLRADGVESLKDAADLPARGRKLVELAHALGARVLLDGEPGYPSSVSASPSSPPVLYVLGNLSDARRAAVVGTRQPDGYGLGRAEAVTRALVVAGLEVVSGGATGVDRKAHEVALEAGARTIAVVGTGLGKCYPSAHEKLYERIARQGAVVSEFAPDAGGQRAHFPRRNRTIAALSEGVVFIQGAQDSGAVSTCDAARRLGRPVFAVPSHVGDRLGEGPNALLARGDARVTLDGREFVRALGLTPGAEQVQAPAGVVAPSGTESVWSALAAQPKHVDDIAQAAGVSTGDALAALLQLELVGLCAALPGTYFQRR